MFRRSHQAKHQLVAVIASCVALAAMGIQVAEAEPGGYRKVTSIQDPAK